MKKSDKLLLGGFLTLLLLITAIHVTLYAKYKSGHYTSFTDAALADELLQPFPHILFISMNNIPAASVQFGDLAQVEKTQAAGLKCVQNGDTLTITGNEAVHQGDVRYPAIINVPYQAKLKISNSSVTFRSSANPDQINPVISLQNSQARFTFLGKFDQFGRIKIAASDSSVISFDKARFESLDVELSHSFMEEMNAGFGQLSIVTDSASRISLQSKHILKAKIKVTGSD